MVLAATARGFVRFRWELGWIQVEANEHGVLAVTFAGSGPETEEWDAAALRFAQRAREEIGEYLAGRRRVFSVPLAVVGTGFQQAVWRAIREIPYGQTRTYGTLAALLGKPGAARAVGAACAANPTPILVPCHRVVGENGRLTGFAGGLSVKEKLLHLERLSA